MTLLDLVVKISAKDEASSEVESAATKALTKAKVMADGIEAAFKGVWSAISTVGSKMYDLLTTATEAYGTFEQQKGGIETFFDGASDTVIENAKKAYTSAGMSANEYMSNVSSFAMSLITSIAKERQAVSEEDVAAQAAALDQQLSDLQTNLEDGYTAKKREYDREYDAQAELFADELDQLRDSLQAQYEERERQLDDEIDLLKESQKERVQAAKDANDAEYTEYKRMYDDRYSALKDELDREIELTKEEQQRELDEIEKANQREYDSRSQALSDALDELRRSLDAEVDAFQKATDEKIKEIDRQYREQVKLYDKEEYDRLKAIDDQIDALNGQTEAERKAHEEQEREKKLSELAKRVAAAESQEEQTKALEAYNSYVAQIEQKQREEQRSAQIASLKEQKEAIKAGYDERKENLRTQVEEEKETYKSSRAEQLEALKESNDSKVEEQQRANKQELDQLAEDQKAYIEQVKIANAEEIREKKAKNEQTLTEEKRANEDALKDLQTVQGQRIKEIETQNANELKEAQRAKQDQLAELKTTNADKVAEVQKGQGDILGQLKISHDDQLKELQRSNKQQIEEYKNYVKEAKAALGNEGGFITPLLEDQQKAAELADIAIRDMADNANKMGTDIGSLEYAYQGFAKGNMTMLDNLKLGYGGTKEEMQRLLTDAESVQASYGIMADYSIDSFADIVQAIHVMQTELGISGLSVDELRKKMENNDFTLQELNKLGKAWGGGDQGSVEANIELARAKLEEMGGEMDNFKVLLGTTAEEGATTYEGAMNRVRAAWENWLISLTEDDWSVTETTKTLMEEVANAASIIIPRVGEILTALWEEVALRAPEIWDTFKTALMDSLPEEWKTKVQEFIDKVKGFFENVSTAIEWVEKFGPALLTILAAKEALDFANGVKTAFEGIHAVISLLTGAGGLASVATAASETAGGVAALETAAAGAAGVGGATGFGALAAAMAPFMLGAALIVGVGGGLLYLVGTNEELMKSIEGVVTKTEDLKTDTEVQTASIGTSWEKMEQSMRVSAEEASNNIQVSTASMYTDIYSKMGDTRTKVETDSAAAKDSAIKSFDDLKTGVSNSMEGAKNTLQQVTGAWRGDLSTMDSEANTKTNSIKTKFDTNMSAVKTKVSDNISKAATAWRTSLTDMDTNATQKTSALETTVGKCVASVKTSFDGASKSTEVAGKNVMIGFHNGLVEKWNEGVAPFIQNITQWIAEHKGPEEYDKRLLVKNGQWIMQSLADGLESGFTGDVTPEVEGLSDRIESAMGGTSFTVGFDATTDGFKAATEQMMQAWKDGTDSMDAETKTFTAKSREMLTQVSDEFSKNTVEGFDTIRKNFRETSEVMLNDWKTTIYRMTVEMDRFRLVTREAMAEMQSSFAASVANNLSLAAQSSQSYSRPTTGSAVMELDRVQFGRLVYQLNDEESQRVGTRLAGGYA